MSELLHLEGLERRIARSGFTADVPALVADHHETMQIDYGSFAAEMKAVVTHGGETQTTEATETHVTEADHALETTHPSDTGHFPDHTSASHSEEHGETVHTETAEHGEEPVVHAGIEIEGEHWYVKLSIENLEKGTVVLTFEGKTIGAQNVSKELRFELPHEPGEYKLEIFDEENSPVATVDVLIDEEGPHVVKVHMHSHEHEDHAHPPHEDHAPHAAHEEHAPHASHEHAHHDDHFPHPHAHEDHWHYSHPEPEEKEKEEDHEGDENGKKSEEGDMPESMNREGGEKKKICVEGGTTTVIPSPEMKAKKKETKDHSGEQSEAPVEPEQPQATDGPGEDPESRITGLQWTVGITATGLAGIEAARRYRRRGKNAGRHTGA